MSEEKSAPEKSVSGMLTKVIATVFASILAPVTVALSIKYLSPAEKPSAPPTAPTIAPSTAPATAPPPTLTVDPSKEKPVSKPEEDSGKEESEGVLGKESLHFNHKNLSGFETYVVGRPLGEDPKGVFTVKDGVLCISGEEPGWLITQKVYQRYQLHTEYKWGERTWGDRQARARTSGIAIHADRRALLEPSAVPEVIFKAGYLCQLVEGRTGDLAVMPSPLQTMKLTSEVDPKKSEEDLLLYQYQPNGKRTTFATSRDSTARPLEVWGLNHSSGWKDVLGFHGKNDLEKPVGEWNTLEVFCGVNNLSVMLNGKQVNIGKELSRRRGKVLIRSAGAEIFFRKIDLILKEK